MSVIQVYAIAREAYEAWRKLSNTNEKHLPRWYELAERSRACIAYVAAVCLKGTEHDVKVEDEENEDVQALIKRIQAMNK